MHSLYPRRPSDDHGHEHVVAFDIETIVEEEIADSSFPPWPKHRPVVASFLSAAAWGGKAEFRLDTILCELGGEAEFYAEVDRLLPTGATIVSFNGRGFDAPVLRIGAMASLNFDCGNIARLAQANRYGREHADLCELMGGYGAARGHSLALLCGRLGIPVKTTTSGADVGALWRAGEQDQVLRYVEEDVAATHYTATASWFYMHRIPGEDRFGRVPEAYLLKDDLVATGVCHPQQRVPAELKQGDLIWREADQAAALEGPQAIAAVHIVADLPLTRGPERWAWLVERYYYRHLVELGMFVSWAIHAKTDGQDGWLTPPHAHLLCTARFWRPNARKGDRQKQWLANADQIRAAEDVWLKMASMAPALSGTA